MKKFGLGFGISASVSAIPIYEVTDFVTQASGDQSTTRAVSSQTNPDTGLAAADILEVAASTTHRMYFSNVPLIQNANYRARIVVRDLGRPVFTFFFTDGGTSKYWYPPLGSTTPSLSNLMSNGGVETLGSGWFAHNILFSCTSVSGNKIIYIGMAILPIATNYLGDITKGLTVGNLSIYRES